MKRLMLLVFVLVSLTTIGQRPSTTQLPQKLEFKFYEVTNFMIVDSGLTVPRLDTNWISRWAGTLVRRPTDGLLYMSTGNYTGLKWVQVGGAGGGGGITALTSVGGGLDIQTGGLGNIRTLNSSDFIISSDVISISNEGLQDDLFTSVVDDMSIDFTYDDVGNQLSAKLVNDETTPTDGKFYGKVGGAKGWFTPPGFNNPMTETGDIIIGGSSGVPIRLDGGSNEQILTMTSGSPAWITGAMWNGNTPTAAYNTDVTLGGEVLVRFYGSTIRTFTLPSRAVWSGHNYLIKNTGSVNMSVVRSGTDNIYNSSDVTSVTLAPGEAAWFNAASDKWYVYFYGASVGAGGGGGFTQEEIEDFTGALFATDNGDIDFTYNDATPDIGAVIKNSAVTLAKMADVATATVFYRKTAGTGAPEVQTLTTLKTDLGLTGTNSGDITLAGTPDYITISGQVITRDLIDLTTDVTGDLPFANLTQIAGFSVLGKTGTGTGDVAAIIASADQVLRRSGSGDLLFGTLVTNNYGANTVTFAKIVQGAANTVVTNPTTGTADFTTTALSASNLLGRGSTGNIAPITVSGILSFSGAVLSATEVDGSTTNELQTINNTSDATSHTITLSNSGGTIQFIEGTGITLTTGGTGAAGTLTIASTVGGGSVTDFIFTDGNGFDGTVTLSTTTPTLSLNTTVGNGQVFYSTSGAPTGSANLTYNAALLTSLSAGLGTTQDDTKGIVLINTTAAFAGAQQISPQFRWSGQGWKTDATAASREVEFSAYVLPVQGTANPSANWVLRSSINGGGYVDNLRVTSNSNIILNTGVVTAGSTGSLAMAGSEVRANALNAIVFSTNAIDSSSNTFMGAGQNTILQDGASGAATFMTDGLVYSGSLYSFSIGDANKIRAQSAFVGGFGSLNAVTNGFAFGNEIRLGILSGTEIPAADLYTDSWAIGNNISATGNRQGTLGMRIENTGNESIVIGGGYTGGATTLKNSRAGIIGFGKNSDSLTVIIHSAAGTTGSYGLTQVRGNLMLNSVPNDDTETRLLTVNASTGDIEYRTVASLPGGGGVNAGAALKGAYYPSAGSIVDDWAGVEFANTNLNTKIITQATTEVGLEIKLQSSQTADAFNVSSSSGTGNLLKFTSSGELLMNGVSDGGDYDLQVTKGLFIKNATTNAVVISADAATTNAGFLTHDGSNFMLYANGSTDLLIQTNSDPIIIKPGFTSIIKAITTGVKIGDGNDPAALLHIKAGTATANTAPLKLTAGTNLTTPEIGAIEFTDNGTTGHLYVTVNVGGVATRLQLDQQTGGSGVTTVGALDGGTEDANGANISGTTIYMQSATASFPGLVTTGTQTFAGYKTFSNGLLSQDILSINYAGAGTNAINWMQDLTYNTTGTPAAGIGSGLIFAAETADGEQSGVRIGGVATDVATGTADFDFFVRVMAAQAVAVEKLRLKSTGQLQLNGYTTTSSFSLTAVGMLVFDASGNIGTQAIPSSNGITIGTTTITSGTNTRVLFNNSGVVGEYTISGSGNVAMTTSATLTTPRFASGGFIADNNGNELIIFTTTASAVNDITFANAATGANPKWTASGGDTDIGIDWLTKGAGKFNLLATASGAAEIRLFEDSDNGTNYIGIIGQGTLGANRTITLPDATGTILLNDNTATITGKSIDASQLTGSVATARLTNVKQIKTIALGAPTTNDDWGFFTNQAITITNVTGVMLGTSQSVTLQLNYGDSRATADGQVVNSIVFDSGETGYQTTGFSFSLTANVNIAAGTFVWFDITAVSGTVNTLELNIEYNLQ